MGQKLMGAEDKFKNFKKYITKFSVENNLTIHTLRNWVLKTEYKRKSNTILKPDEIKSLLNDYNNETPKKVIINKYNISSSYYNNLVYKRNKNNPRTKYKQQARDTIIQHWINGKSFYEVLDMYKENKEYTYQRIYAIYTSADQIIKSKKELLKKLDIAHEAVNYMNDNSSTLNIAYKKLKMKNRITVNLLTDLIHKYFIEIKGKIILNENSETYENLKKYINY